MNDTQSTINNRNYKEILINSNEFFYDISFIDYNNISIKNFFYDTSFEDYEERIDNEQVLIN